MAEQPIVTEPVDSTSKLSTPVFYSIPDTASAVKPVVYEPKQPTGGATSLVGLLPTEAGTASNELARTATDLNNDQPAPEEAGFFEVAKENLAPTMTAMIENYVDSQVFDQDMSYEPQEDADEFFKLHGQGDPYEINVLGSAISAADMLNKQDRLLRKREQQERASQRPFAAIAGSLLDIDLLLGGVGGFATKAGTGARVAERLGQGAVTGAGIYAYNEAHAGSDIRSPDEKIWDVVGFSLSRALAPSAKAAQSTEALDNAVDTELAAVRGVGTPTERTLPTEPTYTPVQTGVRTETTTPDLSQYEYSATQQAPTETVTLYHGTNTKFDNVDPSKSGGIAFFAEDTNVASRYATGAGGNRARTALEDSYLVNEGVAYELKGKKWVAVGEVAEGSEDFVTASTIKPLTKSVPEIEPDEVSELLQVSASITPKNARIVQQEFSNLNLLDITTPEGREVILGLAGDSNFVKGLKEAAKEDRVTRDTLNSNLNNKLWTSTKVSKRYGDQIANDFVKQLESLGYNGIRFTDDSHKSVGVFPSGLAKRPTTTGTGVKTQYQVPPTQSTTVLNPKGYGVNTQQQGLSPKLQQQVQEAQEALEVGLKAPLKTSNTKGLTRTELMKKNQTVNKITSAADELLYYIGDDPSHPAYHLLSSVVTEGDNVATAQAAFMNTYGALLVPTEVALKGAIKDITGAGRGLFGSINGSYQENALTVFKTFQAEMQKLDTRVLAFESKYGRVPNDAEIKSMLDSVPLHPSMRKVMDTYINSGFATRILDDSKTTGVLSTVENADSIVRRPTYFPVKHNYDNMHRLVQDGQATWDDLATFYGEQITTMYPKLLDPKYAKAGRTYDEVQQGAKTAKTNPYKLTVKQVGQHFIETQRQGARSLSDVTTVGMNKEVMHDMLTKAGLTADEAATATKRIFEDQRKQGTGAPKNYRRRIDWDWNKSFTTSKGTVITMADLVDNSAMSSLDAYSRRMAHRNGLGRYGITTEAELDKILESIPDKSPVGTDPQEVRRFLQDVRADLLGNATGAQVPNSIRAAQSLADMFLLAGSGLLSLVDLTTQVVKTGVIKNFSAIHQGMKAAFLPTSKFTKEEAKDFTDIMTGRLMQGSRWKWFMTHYSDNFQVVGGVAEAAQYYGQSARFMNMSETVKRFQIGLLMGTYLNTTKKAAQGSASDIKFLKTEMNMHDDLINSITAEWKKHGGDVDAWNADVRIAYEQKIMHESDNLALTIQKGETPAILEYNAVGKVIFPYMRYAFAAQQKILRRTYNRDGAVGLALLLAAQTPVAMLVASAQNIRQGKEPDEDLVVGTIRAMTALGALNYPLELIMSGFGNNSVTAIAPFSKSYNLVGEFFDTSGRLQDGDYSVDFNDDINWHNVLKNSPLNAATPLHYLSIAFEE